MTQVTDFRFENGDFVLEDLGGGVFDIATVSDNEAVIQAMSLNLDLQVRFNQYFPDAGWDWMSRLHADLDQTAIDDMVKEIKDLLGSIDFTRSAEVTYLGEIDGEAAFNILAETDFGTESIVYALGGRNA